MKIGTLCRGILSLACVAGSALGGEATQRIDERLDAITIPGERERPRERGPLKDAAPQFHIAVTRRDGATSARLTVLARLNSTAIRREVKFRRASAARRVQPEIGSNYRSAAGSEPVSDDRVRIGNTWLSAGLVVLEDNVDEAQGAPASIPFGPHSALVNLDHLRLRAPGETVINVAVVTDPQTRRCTASITLRDDELDGSNRLLLLHDSAAECENVTQGRTSDLLFAADVPPPLRQAVQDVYGPINVGLGNRLGSEPGLVFVAWLPGSAREGWRLERSWDRSSLLLFEGTGWQRGIASGQRQALWAAFAEDQILRRFRQVDYPGALTEAAAHYLLALYTAEQAGNSGSWLTEALPGWIASCDSYLAEQSDAAASPGRASVDCGLVVQFVYDAVARARSAGRSSAYDTWHQLLDESWRRGEEGADPAAFLASSTEAQRIVQGVLDGSVDWTGFAAALEDLGVRLRLDEDLPGASVEVLSLAHFRELAAGDVTQRPASMVLPAQ